MTHKEYFDLCSKFDLRLMREMDLFGAEGAALSTLAWRIGQPDGRSLVAAVKRLEAAGLVMQRVDYRGRSWALTKPLVELMA